jgi:hypothetical protein
MISSSSESVSSSLEKVEILFTRVGLLASGHSVPLPPPKLTLPLSLPPPLPQPPTPISGDVELAKSSALSIFLFLGLKEGTGDCLGDTSSKTSSLRLSGLTKPVPYLWGDTEFLLLVLVELALWVGGSSGGGVHLELLNSIGFPLHTTPVL